MTPEEALGLLGTTIENNIDDLHDDECPQDDTCDCPAAVAVNTAFEVMQSCVDAFAHTRAENAKHRSGIELYEQMWHSQK